MLVQFYWSLLEVLILSMSVCLLVGWLDGSWPRIYGIVLYVFCTFLNITRRCVSSHFHSFLFA